MKKLMTTLLLALAPMTAALASPSITVPEESFSLKGKMLNVELTETAGVVTVQGIAGRYGRVFLTYNMTMNPNSDSQGAFTGRGMGINDEGVRQAGSRQGVWKREGTVITYYSLDDVSDGNQNLCKSVLDISTGEFEMTFYPL
ncbi:MAG: hypothetical protein VW867_06090 [Gammaproteobacteria bacterium]|jgi:hypothetical protein